jgi:thiamine pyrophosphate-dependent acetolactate synthase large subunit-like protein
VDHQALWQVIKLAIPLAVLVVDNRALRMIFLKAGDRLEIK